MIDLSGRTVLVCGVANRRSVGWHVGRRVREAGAEVVYTVRTPERRAELEGKLGGDVLVCDVERPEEIERLREELAERHPRLHGLVHSIARAEYTDGPRPFHETPRDAFLRATQVGAFSLVELSSALRELLLPSASVVAISISTTTMAAENYGYMAPVKAALDSSIAFLAKSFSALGEVRFNAVRAGPLKTSSSAGIPGYVESWLFAEMCTLRKRGLETREVADAALFLLSDLASGVNGQGIVVDAGMGLNHFDAEVVRRATREEETP